MELKGNNVVFFGASALGYQCCERLIKNGVNVSAIFTISKEFNISYSVGKPVNNVLHKDFHQLGETYNIPVVSVEGKMHTYKEVLAEYNPSLIVVIGWYYMIPASLRDLAPLGCVGIHASLLPKYRGGAPLVWAMINGEKETGISLFYFDDGVDTGDIVVQTKIEIEPDDNISHLLKKVEASCISMMDEYIPMLLQGTAPRTQQLHEDATEYPQRKPEDGEIDWTWSGEQINNFIKAQTKPYPGAFTYINGRKLMIWDAEINSNK